MSTTGKTAALAVTFDQEVSGPYRGLMTTTDWKGLMATSDASGYTVLWASGAPVTWTGKTAALAV